MRSDLAAAVTLDTDVTFRVAGLTGLQVSASLGGMLVDSPINLLSVCSQHEVRFDPQRTLGKTAVTRVAEGFCLMAAIALLRIVLSLHGVDADKVAAVALGLVVTPEVPPRKIIARTAALMAIQTPFLFMALAAVVSGLAGQNFVVAYEIGIMVGCYAFALVAFIALLDRHLGILFMCHLFCV